MNLESFDTASQCEGVPDRMEMLRRNGINLNRLCNTEGFGFDIEEEKTKEREKERQRKEYKANASVIYCPSPATSMALTDTV